MRLEIVEIKLRAAIKAARHISLRISNFRISLLFHRKITAVPFTPLCGCGKHSTWA